MDDYQKEKMKKLFSDWNLLVDEKKAISLDSNKLLKKDEQYQKLIKDKKELEHAIKERKATVLNQLLDQSNQIQENIRLIISDVKEDLNVNATVAGSIFRYYKKKFDHDIDELDAIVVNYLEIFQTDNAEKISDKMPV